MLPPAKRINREAFLELEIAVRLKNLGNVKMQLGGLLSGCHSVGAQLPSLPQPPHTRTQVNRPIRRIETWGGCQLEQIIGLVGVVPIESE